MTLPLPGATPEPDGVAGETYGAALVASDGATRDAVVGVLRDIRFTGWIAPPDGGWIVAIGDPGDGTVAADRRGVLEVAAVLADRLGTTAFAVRCAGTASSCSPRGTDPRNSAGTRATRRTSRAPTSRCSANRTAPTMPTPSRSRPDARRGRGTRGRARRGARSRQRVRIRTPARVLGLLGMPRWLVASASLPRDIPTGPGARRWSGSGAGEPGAMGRLRGRAAPRRGVGWHLRPRSRSRHAPTTSASIPGSCDAPLGARRARSGLAAKRGSGSSIARTCRSDTPSGGHREHDPRRTARRRRMLGDGVLVQRPLALPRRRGHDRRLRRRRRGARRSSRWARRAGSTR